MPIEKQWPKPGDRLTHRFRKREGEVTAVVLSVDTRTRTVSVRVGETIYGSLTAAARAFSEHEENGWVFWGLKKQAKKPRKS